MQQSTIRKQPPGVYQSQSPVLQLWTCSGDLMWCLIRDALRFQQDTHLCLDVSDSICARHEQDKVWDALCKTDCQVSIVARFSIQFWVYRALFSLCLFAEHVGAGQVSRGEAYVSETFQGQFVSNRTLSPTKYYNHSLAHHAPRRRQVPVLSIAFDP